MSDLILYEKLSKKLKSLSTKQQIEALKEKIVPKYISSNLKHMMFEWQIEAVENLLLYNYLNKKEKNNCPSHLMFNMATGSGKTLIMAASILFYYKQGYRHFIFFVDQTNIVGKTQSNFIDKSHPKYLFKDRIFIDDIEVELKEVDVFNPETENIEIKFVTTAKLHNDIHGEKENNITLNQLDKLDIVLLADEAHHLNADTKKDKDFLELELATNAGINSIERRGWEHTAVQLILNKNNNYEINKNVMLEFTATIDMNKKVFEKYRDKIIYKFDLKDFLQKGYTKEINLISSNLDKKSRIIQALLFNWYREEIALKHYKKGYKDLVNFKPVILFRSKTIEESKEDYNEFLKIIENLNEEDFFFLNEINKHIKKSDSLNEQGFSKTVKLIEYINTNNLSYAEIIRDIKIRFAKENCIITNSETNNTQTEKTTEEQEELLNNLEDHNNFIRAIFTVKRLTEGWDVLNLFDIVRLYQGQNGQGTETTTQEKQLIGRGVRYYPFKFNDSEINKRKFDNDISHELRVLEELNYYTYDEGSRYISDLKAELRKDGYIVDGKIVKSFSVKDSFKEEEYYKNKKLWINYKQENENKIKNTLDEIDKNFYKGYVIKSLEYDETRFFENIEEEKERLKIANKEGFSIFPKFKDFEKNLVYKAISQLSYKKNSIYRFNNLKEKLNVKSVDDLFKDEFLGDFSISIVSNDSSKKDLALMNRSEQLAIIKEFLIEFEKEIDKFINPHIGSEFEAISFKEIFEKPKSKSINKTDYINQEAIRNEIINEDWFVLDNFYGTDQEVELINVLRGTIGNLRSKYDQVFLLRNEEVYKIYDFEEGRGFQPDFILLLKDKNKSNGYYQIFIEPKGEHLLKEDEWKQDFLLEITEKYKNGKILELSNDKYNIIGLPLFNSNDSNYFDKEYKKIWS